MKLKICETDTAGVWGVFDHKAEGPGYHTALFKGTQYECAEFVLQQTGGKPDDCPAADAWNCKYCSLVEKCKLHSHGEPKAYSELRLDNVGLVEHPIDEGTRIHQAIAEQEVMLQANPPHRKLSSALSKDDLLLYGFAASVNGERVDPTTLTMEFLHDPMTSEQRASLDQFFAERIEHFRTNDPLMYRAWTGRNPKDPDAGSTWGNKSREEILADINTAFNAVRLNTPPRTTIFAKEVAEGIAKDAQRYGVVKSTTDWDTAEGAIRLRFFDYASCQIAVRMHNGVLTHLYVNGNCCYDAH